LEIKDGSLRGLLFFASEAIKTIKEAIGDAEFHFGCLNL
jgi:hypothetical protein